MIMLLSLCFIIIMLLSLCCYHYVIIIMLFYVMTRHITTVAACQTSVLVVSGLSTGRNNIYYGAVFSKLL
jgi:hypothetical protein